MSRPPHEATYTLKRVQDMLGLSRGVVTGLMAAGFVTPSRGARNEYRFTLQDLMLLRTAHGLQSAKIAPRKILRALARLRASLPAELPLTGLRISAVDRRVVVRDPVGPRDADSGQRLIDFEVMPQPGGSVAFLSPQHAATAISPASLADARPAGGRTAGNEGGRSGRSNDTGSPAPTDDNPDTWFRLGERLESADVRSAESAYRRAVALQPGHAHACLNLGALLCEASRCEEAVALYERALQHGASHALLHFNHAIALEDQGRSRDALGSYERALIEDATLADAHYNAGCLLEKLGDPRGALRHFSAYRRLRRQQGA